MSTNAVQIKGIKIPMIARYSDLATAVAAVVIMGMMVMPLPEWMLDILLPLNVAMSLTILLVTVYINEPLQFSSFLRALDAQGRLSRRLTDPVRQNVLWDNRFRRR